jgi:hypothetical protein
MRSLKFTLNPLELEVESFTAPAASQSLSTVLPRPGYTDNSCYATCLSGGDVCCA